MMYPPQVPVILTLTLLNFPFSNSMHLNHRSQKLLIILFDGFRWDYYNMYKEHLPGFTKFLSKGVKVEYVEPVFPSLSLPSWTTITTGLYPAYHNILGNTMLQRATETNPELTFDFKDNSSMDERWWQSAEPLWATAVKHRYKVYMSDFSRCEVPYKGILPTECTGYKEDDLTYDFQEHLNKVVERFKQGYTLGMIYSPWIDVSGHKAGPNSQVLLESLIDADRAIQELLENLKLNHLHNKVNVVITSDHGSTDVSSNSGVTRVRLEDYLGDPENVYKVIGSEALSMIATQKGKTDLVYNSLKAMPGVHVYKKEDIPDALHFREGRYVQDILVVAKPKYFILEVGSSNASLPKPGQDNTKTVHGTHGYYNLTDMRSIFFARGPAFKRGVILPPIRLVDQYQIFTFLLHVPPANHNGTWANVEKMFSSKYFM